MNQLALLPLPSFGHSLRLQRRRRRPVLGILRRQHPNKQRGAPVAQATREFFGRERRILGRIIIAHRPRANPGTVFTLPFLFDAERISFSAYDAGRSWGAVPRPRGRAPTCLGGLGGFGGLFHS